MRRIVQPKLILIGVAIVLLIVLLAVLVWSAVRVKAADFEITLTEEEVITLSKIKASSMSVEEFLEAVSQLEEENQNYILETLGDDNLLLFLQTYGINVHWFEEEHIHELYETIARDKGQYSEYDVNTWHDTIEPYLTTTIPSENSTHEEFMEYINSYFDEIGYIAEYYDFCGNGDIVTYLAYDWGRSMKISFMRSQKVSEEIFKIDEWNGSEYYVMPMPEYPCIILDGMLEKAEICTAYRYSTKLYATQDGKYMMFYLESQYGELWSEDRLLIREAFAQ